MMLASVLIVNTIAIESGHVALAHREKKTLLVATDLWAAENSKTFMVTILVK
jgi:hypothetical protein